MLFQNHLDNKITTTTSIIQASGLPFATGLRKVNKLIKKKKLIQRSKTKSGKSFSIHPSNNLIKEFTDYFTFNQKRICLELGFGDFNDNYFFGTSLSAGNIIPAPTVITNQNKKYKKINFYQMIILHLK